MEEPQEYVDFMVKYKDWLAIKRLGIYEATKPEEIINHLAVIRNAIDKRSYNIMGINTQALDAIASKISSDRKRSYESLADAIKELQKPDVKRAIKEAVPNDTIAKLAEIYLFNSVINSMKFESGITPELMGKLYPDIKVRMPMGAGRKKKNAADKKN